MGAPASRKTGLPAEFNAEVYGFMDALIQVEDAGLVGVGGLRGSLRPTAFRARMRRWRPRAQGSASPPPSSSSMLPRISATSSCNAAAYVNEEGLDIDKEEIN